MFAASKSGKVSSGGGGGGGGGTGDAQFNFVTTLLNGDGTNGAQNNTFVDSSTNNSTITSYGNTTQASVAPFGANWSNLFNGTSDYFTVAVGTSTNIPSNTDFTFECWVYLRAHTSGYPCIFNNYSSGGNFALFAGHNGFGPTNYNLIMGGALKNSSSTIAYNTWTHIAVVRNGTGTNNCTFYINGVAASGATFSDNGAVTSVGTNNFIGTAGDSVASSYIDGYISNLRLVNGTAVYTGNFTPSTAPLTAITGTVLLTCQSPYFKDNSTNAFAVTLLGTPSVQRFSPFSNVTQTPQSYATKFNGSTDFLKITSGPSIGSGDYTVEFWVYHNSLSSDQDWYETYSAGSANIFLEWDSGAQRVRHRLVNDAGTVNFDFNSTAALTVNTWNHLAFVVSGTTAYTFINGNYTSLGATTTVTGSRSGTFTTSYIGVLYSESARFMNGYISNLRVVKGTALYTSNFTPSTTPLTAIANTSLLTCQDATINDKSTNAYAVTAYGTPTPKAVNPFGFTTSNVQSYGPSVYGGSMYFDGAGDYLSVPASAGTNFGTGDFTIEMWIKPSSVSSYNMLYAGGGYLCLVWGATASVFGLNANNGVQDVTSTALVTPINQWTHIAFVRVSGTLYFYINGVASGSGGFSSAFGTSTGTVSIAYNPVYAGSYYTNAGISNLRVVKGTAVYTSNFTPPTAPVTAITGTQLLLNGTNAGIYDSAMQTVFETVGNAQVSTTQKKYGTGAMYFDGSGDWLVSPITTSLGMSGGDFTIEGWFYLTNPTYAQGMFHVNATAIAGTNAGYAVGVTSSGVIQYYAGTTFTNTSASVPANTWTHIAMVRSGGTVKVYVNGVLPSTGGSIADSQNVASATAFIGLFYSTPGANYAMTGYIDDFRITKGYARYTANFTPPTAALPTY